MNERIKELADQVGLQHKVMLDDSSRDIDVFVTKYDESVPSLQIWEKFAKLIVQECTELLAESEVDNRLPIAVDDMIFIINTHFGVEE